MQQRRFAMPARRLVATVVAGLVLVQLSAGGSTAVPTVSPTLEARDCPTAIEDQSAALTTAVACGEDVEVLAARTPWDTLTAQADGTMRWDSSATAVRTQVDDEWADVDPSVVAGDGGLVIAAPVTPMTFSDGTDGQPLVRMERDGHELTFDVPLDLPTPDVAGDRITYGEVLPGVDLIVTVSEDATGFSEVLRVDSPEAAADPRLAELRFPISVSDDLDLAEASGGFVATDQAGERVFTSPTPAMWDSASSEVLPAARGRAIAGRGGVLVDPAGILDQEHDPVDGPTVSDEVAMMPAQVSVDAVTIVPDAELLTDPETVWPVYIDPQISGSRNLWTAVRDGYGQNWAFDPDEGVGLCSRATSTSCSKTFRSRLLWTFTGLGTIGALTSDQIISATFAAVGTHSYDCTARPVTAYRVADFSSATPWPGGGLWEPMSTLTVATKSTCAGQPVRWLEFDATSQARAIADANTAQGSMGIAVDESSMAYWKRFRNDAGFSVTYNRAPNPASNLAVTAGSVTTACSATPIWVNTTTPTLRATISDPDGGNVQAWFALGVNTISYQSGVTAPQASGSVHSLTLPAGVVADGGTYGWSAVARDEFGWDTGGPWCAIGVDVTPPAAPTLTAVTGSTYPTLYPAGAWAGGVGQTGGFQMTSSSDVVSYRWSFNNTALTNVASGSWSIVGFAPTTVGPQTLRVQAVDRAGNVSPVSLYTFNVAFPTVSAMWTLDAGAGTVAADSGAGGNRSPLALAGTPVWAAGPMSELAGEPADRSLRFDTPDDTAVTSKPVVATLNSFTVAATVKLDAVPAGAATAVSQDGTATSGFELGYRTTGCPGGSPGCWSFGMSSTDSAASGTAVATSTVAATPGQWVYLAGVHNASTDTVKLYVCPLEDDLALHPSSTVPFTSTWDATGAFRLGQARRGATAVSGFAGAVADVQVLDGVAGDAQLLRACNRTFSTVVDPS